MTEDINNMRAYIISLTSSLGEEGSKTIEDLKREMVLMVEENIKLFNEERTKTYFFKSLPKLKILGSCVSNNNWQFKTDNSQ